MRRPRACRKEVFQSLENARLIQVEQRNQSQWAELTHDSMVAAVQASNKAWGRTRRHTRLWRTAALTVALGVLLALFPLLLAPSNQTFLLRARGNTGNDAEHSVSRRRPR